MPELERPAERTWLPIGEAGAVAAGMCLFALFIHSSLPLALVSWCGLLATALVLNYSITAESSPAKTFGLSSFSRKACVCTVIGCLLGVGLGIAFRRKCGWDLLIGAPGRFGFVAALVGTSEEIVYRGYVQGRASRLGAVCAVIFAALSHTAYKCALFTLPPFAADTDLVFLAKWTFLGGLALGALREIARSTAPPLAAHALFDIIVYGECTQMPWWVWS